MILGVAAAIAGLTGLAGCGPAPSAQADPGQARDVLRQALDAWQAGDTPESLLQKTPPVRVMDREWQTGVKLVRYKVEGDVPFAAELRCRVLLTLQPPGKAAKDKKAVFAVGTSPAITVVREEDP